MCIVFVCEQKTAYELRISDGSSAVCSSDLWPIVRILHKDGDAHFAAASGLVRPMEWVPDAHDAVFHKRVHNAFTGTGLEAWLRERGIGREIGRASRRDRVC